MDIFDRIASQFQKEARIPSVGNPKYEPCPCKNPKAKGPCKCPTGETWTEKEVKDYYEDVKGSLGKEWAKYEGAFDPSSGRMIQWIIDKNVKNMGGGKGKKASFYDEEIIDDLGFDREASFYDDEIIDDLGFDREASFYDEEIIDDIGFDREASFYDDEIIDDLGFDRTASDREAELLAEDLMVLADEIMSGKRRGPMSGSMRRAIGKALKKSLDRGSNLKNRTKKTNKTLSRARTQENKARAKIRKNRKYDRYRR